MTTNNLWGAIPDGSDIRTPFTILKEQGSVLEQGTKGLLVGSIGRATDGEQTILYFSITAPALNNYSYQILRIVHSVGIYPLSIVNVALNTGERCENESTLLLELGKILGAENTKKVIGGLLAQIRAEIPG